jgi:hypothetical protein
MGAAAFTWRSLEGVVPGGAGQYTHEPDMPIPPVPVTTPTVSDWGPWGTPWLDGLEDPFATMSGITRPSPNPQIDEPDVGWQMPPGDYRGEYRTRGPVQPFSHEATGGFSGNQAVGRIMRFPANIPERYDVNGVNVGDYRDLLAQTLEANSVPEFTDTEVVSSLVQWTGPSTFNGWEG